MTGDLQAFLRGVYQPQRRKCEVDPYRAVRQMQRMFPKLQLDGWGYP